jgi:hypothetical protein
MITTDCPALALRSPNMWHPWRALRAMPEVTLHLRRDLPVGLRATTDGRQIVLSARLLQRERRAALAHELEHIRQHRVSHCNARDESYVRQAAARRLITIERLADALQWSQHMEELAEELWVDEDTVRCRLDHLHPSERHYLRQRSADVGTTP